MSKKPKTRKARNTECLNCATSLDSKFCPECGQKNKDYHLSFKDLFSDLIEEVLDVDSRLIQSVKFLFTKPGFLTSEYVKGRRVSYLPPLRIYLVASVVFFLAMTLKTMLPDLQPDRIMQEISDFGKSGDGDTILNGLGSESSDSLSQSVATELNSQSSDDPVSLSINEKEFDVKQGDFLATFRDNFAKMMFLLLPVAALQLKMLYWRRRKLYVEHLVFSLHVHAFIFSLLILTVLFEFKVITWVVILASLIYTYMAMKAYYDQSHVKTTIKLLLLLLSYGFALVLVMTLTLVGTALGLVLEGGV